MPLVYYINKPLREQINNYKKIYTHNHNYSNTITMSLTSAFRMAMFTAIANARMLEES